MKAKGKILFPKSFPDQRKHKESLTIKLFLLCCGLFFLFPFTSHSQNFIPLIEENKSWSCAWEEFDNLESYKIWFEGDTIINGFDYKKIFREHHFHPYEEIIGYIREDSLGRVYSMNVSFEEGLLYDFSAEQGDTIVMHNTMMDDFDYNCPFFDKLTIVVDSVYTIDTRG